MSDLTTTQPTEIQQIIVRIESGTEMTRQEVRDSVAKIQETGALLRWRLLELFERKAYKTDGYSSWEEFCKEQLNINMEQSNIANLLRWARVERNLTIVDTKETENIYDGIYFPKFLTRDNALTLAKLEPEQQREVYNKVNAVEATDVMVGGPGMKAREIKHLVKRVQSGTETSVKTTPTKPDTPKTPASTSKTFTPPSDPEPQESSPVIDFDVSDEVEPQAKKTAPAMDFTEVIDWLNTARTWAENEQVDASRSEVTEAESVVMKFFAWAKEN